jgi:hypothetical protein
VFVEIHERGECFYLAQIIRSSRRRREECMMNEWKSVKDNPFAIETVCGDEEASL